MALMRHSDRRLTDKIYTEENLLETWGAFASLPDYGQQASQIASQVLGASGQAVALPVTTGGGPAVANSPANIRESHIVALPVTMGHIAGNGGSGGARTRHKSNEIKGETGLPSQIASQKQGAVGHDLSQVVTAWGQLSAPLKAAILAIVRTAAESFK